MSTNTMMVFKPEKPNEIKKNISPWNVLIVDDDDSVHAVTKLVLKDFEYMDKPIHLIHAYSEKEAIEKITEAGDTIALILLDVVMEDEKSGLRIVDYIRNGMKNISTRIILRTGQPGEAPEKKVIIEYDINDYKLKTELSAERLFVTVFTGIRNYKDLCRLENGKENLRKMLDYSRDLYKNSSYKSCVVEVLKHLKYLIQGKEETPNFLGVFATKKNENYYIEAIINNASKDLIGKNIAEILPNEKMELILSTNKQKQVRIDKNDLIAHFENNLGNSHIIYFQNIELDDKIEEETLEVFCTNASSAIENHFLSEEISKTQKEIIFTLSEIVENKSFETGNHIKRVCEYTRIFAELYGVPKQECELIAIASTMHDIGKIIVDDKILQKPGKLTEREFEVIKKHSTVGYDMLKNSKGKIIKYAAIIAHQHHEKFNGKGYPLGLKGNQINIYARMVSIVDVLDALVSKRVYKEEWTIEQAIEEIKKEKGEHFDSELVDLFLDNIDRFLEVLQKYKD